MALESAIAFVDGLYSALKTNGNQRLSVEEIDAAFEQATKARRDRAVAVNAESMRAIRLGTWSNRLLEILDKYVIGYVPVQIMLRVMTAACRNGYVSDSLPQPVPKFDQSGLLACGIAD
jgi:ribonuclease I